MRHGDHPREQVAAARDVLERVKAQLLTPTPQTLDGCSQPLDEVAVMLRRLHELDNVPDRDNWLEQVRGLERELVAIGELLEQAAQFYLGCNQVLVSATGSYDAAGDLQAPAGATVSVKG
jgi:hypothetical protein